MDIEINPTSKLDGTIIAPGSKSYSHRAFVAASLAEGISIIKNPLTSGDVEITMDVLRSLGVKILKKNDNSYIVRTDKDSFRSYKKALDCKNSGTTIRIFSALSLKRSLVVFGKEVNWSFPRSRNFRFYKCLIVTGIFESWLS